MAYIKTECCCCGAASYHDIELDVVDKTIKTVRIKDSVHVDSMVRVVCTVLEPHIREGMDKRELVTIIVQDFGMCEQYAWDMLHRVKERLGLHSPDAVHLYHI